MASQLVSERRYVAFFELIVSDDSLLHAQH